MLTLLLLFSSIGFAVRAGHEAREPVDVATVPAPTPSAPVAEHPSTTAPTTTTTTTGANVQSAVAQTVTTHPPAPTRRVPAAAAPAPATPSTAPVSPPQPVVCKSGDVTLVSEGLDRRYVVTRPTTQRTTAPPILLLFHGYSGSPEAVSEASRLPAAASAAGWLVVAPQGSGDPSRWALQSLPAPDDVAFVRHVIADVGAGGCADTGRVAAVGYSNGAGFAATLTCELDLVASGLVAGANLGRTCGVENGYPIVVSHGEADDVVPIEGGDVIGGALKARPLRDTVGDWRASGADVTTSIVRSWGHAWPPGASEAVLEVLATVA